MKRAKCAQRPPPKRDENGEVKGDPWFPGKGESLNVGKIECFTCEVRAECLDYRDRTGSSYGMWGGIIQKRDENAE